MKKSLLLLLLVCFATPALGERAWKILDTPGKDRWYPQVIGLDRTRRETDKLASRAVRLFVRGQSRWKILFLKPGEQP